MTGSSGTTPIGGSPSGATTSSSQASTASYTSDKRGYTAAKYGLALDGVQVGFVKSVAGGPAPAVVIEETVGPGSEVKKHIGPPRYEDIAVNIGWDSKLLLDWAATSWKTGYQRKNGSVLEADYSSQIRNEREFFNALVSGVTMPTLDLSSKDAASIVVNFAPEYTRSKAASGLLKVPDLKAQKRWLASTFRFEMSGLDGTKVNKIESFTVSQKVVNDEIGDARDAAKAPGKLNFPNLKVTLSESSSQGWWDWYNDFLIQGNNTEDKERNGSIVYLDPSLKVELGRINLYNCGIFGLAPKKMEAGADGIRRVEADLYCEKMELVTKSS
ncbi:MAG: phage tail protein [Gemmatimonadales bacterium]